MPDAAIGTGGAQGDLLTTFRRPDGLAAGAAGSRQLVNGTPV
jgi:hypothetical protein